MITPRKRLALGAAALALVALGAINLGGTIVFMQKICSLPHDPCSSTVNAGLIMFALIGNFGLFVFALALGFKAVRLEQPQQ